MLLRPSKNLRSSHTVPSLDLRKETCSSVGSRATQVGDCLLPHRPFPREPKEAVPSRSSAHGKLPASLAGLCGIPVVWLRREERVAEEGGEKYRWAEEFSMSSPKE